MGDFILTSTSTIHCPHGGVVRHIPMVPTEYRIEGAPPMLIPDQYLIIGCPFISTSTGAPFPVPTPCFSVTWTNPSIFLIVRGVPALKNTSTGLCMTMSMIPQGPAIVTAHQMSVQEPDQVTIVN